MINGWLNSSNRSVTAFPFNVVDVQEIPGAVPQAEKFASLLREAYWGEDYLSGLAARYGWEAVKERFLQARMDTQLRVKRGDFGEAVAVQYLTEVENYSIPVAKLRFKITSNQTLPGTDCIAVKVTNSKLVEVCYLESKLRTTKDLSVAIAGANQLKQDADITLPEIVTFVARRLRQEHNNLAGFIEEYIFSRDTGLDSFKLMLFQERNSWDEKILENLNDEEIELRPLCVYVVKVDNLVTLSNNAFTALGVIEVRDDDN
jgi:hypothetical protein